MMQPIVLSLAALAIVASAASALVAALLFATERWLGRITGSARARLLFVAAVSPAVIALSVVAVAHAPSIGLGDDHCFDHGGHHAHLCFEHVLGKLGWVPWIVAAVFAARLLAHLTEAVGLVVRSRRAARELGLVTRVEHAQGIRVVDDPEPHAFVLGYVSPRVFVTRALLEGAPDELAAVVAHERAHGQRRDPLRRLVARSCMPFHLPWIGRILDRRLALAQEMAADEAAAGEVGDGARVAQAILHVARRRARIPQGAAALGGSDVAARVTLLLDDRERYDVPSARAVGVATVLLLVCAAALAEPLHHSLEHLLGALM